jgi:hypothetical protein
MNHDSFRIEAVYTMDNEVMSMATTEDLAVLSHYVP